MCAAHADHFRIVKMLINHGANLDLRTDSGWTALMLSAWLGHIKTVCFLLEAGADKVLRTRTSGQLYDVLRVRGIMPLLSSWARRLKPR